MSEDAKRYRAAAKEKAHRLANGDPHAKVDASDWTPPEQLETTSKTGMRPVSKRQFKRGGKVHGEHAKKRADYKPRKAGGRLATELMNRDQKEANESRAGTKHIGGMKKGGRAHKADGGSFVPTSRMQFQGGPSILSKAGGIPSLKRGGKAHGDEAEDKALIRKMVKKDDLKRKDGGRAHRSHGGEDDGGYFSGAPRTAPDHQMIRALREHGFEHSYQNGVLHAHIPYSERGGPGGIEKVPIGNSVAKLRNALGYRRGGSVSDGELEGTRPSGGRMAHRDGGKADHWIAGATKNKGALHRKLHVPEGEKIPAKKLAKAEHSKSPTERKEANLAENLKEMHRKRGGRTGKGKMNVNIVIAPQGGHEQAPPMASAPPPPMPPPMAPRGLPVPAGSPQGGLPPGMMLGPQGAPSMPPGGPMMPRKRGGRTYPDMTAGALSGEGRLEKIRAYGHKAAKPDPQHY